MSSEEEVGKLLVDQWMVTWLLDVFAVVFGNYLCEIKHSNCWIDRNKNIDIVALVNGRYRVSSCKFKKILCGLQVIFALLLELQFVICEIKSAISVAINFIC